MDGFLTGDGGGGGNLPSVLERLVMRVRMRFGAGPVRWDCDV